MHSKLSTVAKAVRFCYALLFVLLMVAVYLMVIHLAPNAYIAIGLAFALILLAALGLMLSGRRQMTPALVS